MLAALPFADRCQSGRQRQRRPEEEVEEVEADAAEASRSATRMASRKISTHRLVAESERGRERGKRSGR